jgi:hypothetical protein
MRPDLKVRPYFYTENYVAGPKVRPYIPAWRKTLPYAVGGAGWPT